METARCRAFVVAADTGSFSKAAEALSYTPSGVNQLVTALEKELGFPLFRRNTKGVSLTENGRLLLPSIRKFLRQEDRIFELSAEMNGLLIGSVNIAAYSSIATHWLPAVIGAFQRDYPQIHVNLLEGIWQEVAQWLDDRTADIGFLSYQEDMPYDWIPLAEDPMLALLPKDHPLARAKAYPLANCAVDRFIMPAKGCDDDFGVAGSDMAAIDTPPFFCIKGDVGMSGINAGVMVDNRYRVIDTEGAPIPGLYAAGIQAGNPCGGINWSMPGGFSNSHIFTAGRYTVIHALTGDMTPAHPASFEDLADSFVGEDGGYAWDSPLCATAITVW